MRKSKAALRKMWLVLLVLLLTGLACNLPRNPDEERFFTETLVEEGGQVEKTAAVEEQQRIEQDFGGTRRYEDDPSVPDVEASDPCKPVNDVTHYPSLDISFVDDILLVVGPQGPIQYTRNEPSVYCRMVEDEATGKSQTECLRFEDNHIIMDVYEGWFGAQCHHSAATLSNIAWTEADEQMQMLPECLAVPNWKHVSDGQSSGTGGLTCNGRFIVKNDYQEPLFAKFYSVFDNHAMLIKTWKNMPLAPGEEGEERVSQTNYKDGVVTYTHVEKLFVFYDVPKCDWLKLDENQWIWEEKAQVIAPFTCP